jgi:hypothetical protein
VKVGDLVQPKAPEAWDENTPWVPELVGVVLRRGVSATEDPPCVIVYWNTDFSREVEWIHQMEVINATR